MPNLAAFARSFRVFCLPLVALLLCGTMWGSGSTTIVISQMYGGGGSATGIYNADYVELYNLGTTTVDISNYAVQYGSATGTSSTTPYAIPSGTTLAPGHYYLVAATAGTGLANLPVTPDVTFASIAFSATAGKVFLTNTATALTLGTNGCPVSTTTVVDFIGYGTTANCYEGSGPAPAPSTTTADVRVTLTDADQNTTDFAAQAPNPHSSTGASTTPPATPAIALTTSTTSAVIGSSIVLMAQFTGYTTAPAGTVTFYDGSNSIGTGTIVTPGTYQLATSALALGTHTITIKYSGDATFPSTSTTTPTSLTVKVVPVPVPDFMLSLANTGLIATSSSKVQQTVVSVSMIVGFSSPVTLTCSGLPGGARCLFTPSTLTTSGNSTMTIGIDGAENHNPSHTSERISLAFGALALPLLLRRRKKLARVALAVLLMGALGLGVSGCSSGASTAVGSSTLTVTGTGGGITHTATITLMVQ